MGFKIKHLKFGPSLFPSQLPFQKAFWIPYILIYRARLVFQGGGRGGKRQKCDPDSRLDPPSSAPRAARAPQLGPRELRFFFSLPAGNSPVKIIWGAGVRGVCARV